MVLRVVVLVYIYIYIFFFFGWVCFFGILRGWEKSKITLTIKKNHVNEMMTMLC